MRPSCAATASTCASGIPRKPAPPRAAVARCRSMAGSRRNVARTMRRSKSASVCKRTFTGAPSFVVKLLVQQRIGRTRTTAEFIKLCFRLFEVGVNDTAATKVEGDGAIDLFEREHVKAVHNAFR